MKILIVGAGKLGYKIASAISTTSADITVVDNDAEVLDKVREHLDVLTIKASGVQIEALQNINIGTFDLAIAVTDSDETNIIVCSLAKKLGCKKTIARIRGPEYSQQKSFLMSIMGIDYAVNPELATANEIIRYLLRGYTFYAEDFAEGKVLMIDFNASNIKDFIGKKLKELDISGLLVAAISRNGEVIIPHGESQILDGDVLYIIGNRDSINQFSKKCKTSLPAKYVKKVMILGGGKIGYYLAENLIRLGMQVKIIEQDKSRCEYLSEKLENALVICGDGSDLTLLEEEGINIMDAFVGVTGYDEENLLMTLMAKRLGVKKAVAKVSKSSYAHIIERLGVDVALNPLDITASDILRFIRGGRTVSVSLLLGGQAEVTEIIADEDMPIVGKRIADLGLPKGIIIGAVSHKGKVFIPNGNSVIYPGDRFVVLCLPSAFLALEAFFKPSKGGLFSELWNHSKGNR
ncbi:MAG TPA: Trk system potassium transporter TrkA [Clostridiaceae bacterium]|nr:Trk system potassium transporter TrkA [Clostridiaceae bacterium]